MTRGNQRDIDRAKKQARDDKVAKDKQSAGPRLLKQMTDAEKMREK